MVLNEKEMSQACVISDVDRYRPTPEAGGLANTYSEPNSHFQLSEPHDGRERGDDIPGTGDFLRETALTTKNKRWQTFMYNMRLLSTTAMSYR